MVSGVLLAVAVLATWRVTHLFAAEDGPWNVIAHLRRLAPGPLGPLMDCFYCLSLWVAILPALLLGHDWPTRALAWPAVSAGAILLERLTRPVEPPFADAPLPGAPPHPEGRT